MIDGDATLSLLDSTGQLLVQSDGEALSNQDASIVQQVAVNKDVFYVRVTPRGKQPVAYTLSAEFEDTIAAPSAPLGISPSQSTYDGLADSAADFNRDGIVDIAVSGPSIYIQGQYKETLQILLGLGDGTFHLADTIAVDSDGKYQLSDVITADYNADGIADVAAASFDGGVWVALGIGDGTFQPPRQISYSVSFQLVTADFNGDAIADLALQTRLSVQVLLGNRDGSFRPAPLITSLPGTSLIAGDFNGDGRSDLAAPGINEILLALGRGDGTFADLVHVSTGLDGAWDTELAVGDVNRDGRTDVLYAVRNLEYRPDRPPARLIVLLGTEQGLIRVPNDTVVGTTYDEGLVRMAVADFNSDGRPDLAALDGKSHDLAIALGNNDGTFNEITNFEVRTREGSGGSLLVQDLDGDGRVDIVSDAADGYLVPVRGRGDGSFAVPVRIKSGLNSFLKVAVGDFNGDGRDDAAVADSSIGLYLRFDKEVGTYGAGRRLLAGAYYEYVIAADFNADGRLDLAASNYISDTITVLLGLGNGTFRDAVVYSVPGLFNAYYYAVDATGDGILDLLSNSSMLRGNGDGTFQPATAAPAPLDPDLYYSVVADFNGDGLLDRATQVGGSVEIRLANHDGSFRNPISYPITSKPVVGDFNGDGVADLASYANSHALTIANLSQTVSVLLGNGDGTFHQGPTTTVDRLAPTTELESGDFNGDGISDLIRKSGTSTNYVTVFLGTGDGSFISSAGTVDLRQFTPLCADINGDHVPDIVTVDARGQIVLRQGRPLEPNTFAPPITVDSTVLSRGIALLTGNGETRIASIDAGAETISIYTWQSSGTFSRTSFPFAGKYATKVVAADLNHDGLDDLVVYSAADGKIRLLLGNGSGLVPFQELAVGVGVADVIVQESDDNGLPDIALTNQLGSTVTILRHQPVGSFASPAQYRAALDPTGYDEIAGLATGDWNHDGQSDLAVVDSGTWLVGILLNTGGAMLNPLVFRTSSTPLAIATARFDADGNLDLAVLEDNGVEIFLGDGTGSFRRSFAGSAGTVPSGISTADVDGDGRTDLMIASELGDVLIVLGNGDGTFRALVRADQRVVLAVADLNGDGQKEFIYANKCLTVYRSGRRLTVKLGPRTPTYYWDPVRCLLMI